MIPALLARIALVIIIARSLYEAYILFKKRRKSWFDLLYQVSIAVVCFWLMFSS